MATVNENPSSTLDDDRDRKYEKILTLMRPFVQNILWEMSSGRDGQSPEVIAVWQQLAQSLSNEAIFKRAIDEAVNASAVERARDQICEIVDGFVTWRWREEDRLLDLLVDRGDVYVSVKGAATIADCSERTIRRALEVGTLTRYWVGSDPRVRLGDLRDYVAKNPRIDVGVGDGQHTRGGGPDEKANGQPELSGKPDQELEGPAPH
jgi:hypothetical protein